VDKVQTFKELNYGVDEKRDIKEIEVILYQDKLDNP
jgi:hypothetical protein